MKKILSTLLVAATCAFGVATNANAALISIEFTTDNVLRSGGVCETEACTSYMAGFEIPDTLPGLSSWQQMSYYVFPELSDGTYHLAFEVSNVGSAGSGNPGAFLATINSLYGTWMTDSQWEVFDGQTGDFISYATEYGQYGVRPWNTRVDGDSDATWIWDSTNIEGAETIWLRTSVHVNEPSMLALLGLGLIGFSMIKRAK